MAATAERPAGRLTMRDREIAAWLERVELAEAEQVARRFSLWPSKCYERLRVLAARGAVRHERVLHGRPGVYLAPGRRVRLDQYEHALAQTELVVERELAGERVLTERELRASAEVGGAPADQRYTVESAGRRHVPDLVTPDELVAYELERSSKGARRRRRILAAYAASDYRRVVYRTSPALAPLIEREADEQGAGALVVVEAAA